MVYVNDLAVTHLNKQAEGFLDGTPYLVVGLKKYGCNGWTYEFLLEEHDFIDVNSGYELSVNPEWNFIIAVPSQYADIVSGGTISYHNVDSFNKKLVLEMPQSRAFCGCGESFTLQ